MSTLVDLCPKSALEVGLAEGPLDEPLALYVHIPFCVRKCHYCDFNSGPASDEIREQYVEALAGEIAASPWRGSRARTVFFGGGTPSELKTPQLERIVEALRVSFEFPATSSPVEWTIECNPGTVSPQSIRDMRSMGFNRVSLGVQSFHDHHLQAIGRIHTAEDARDAYRWTRDAGFGRISLDLIFCLPGQTLEEWKRDVEDVLALKPEHVSLYNLTIEENTEFGRRFRHGELSVPDEDLSADMYEWVIERAAAAGLEQYEVSNFARPGEECRHNQVYWRHEPFVGFGVSAASYIRGRRWTNTGSMARYLATSTRDGGPERATDERLPAREAAGESMMLGLRTREGADLREVGVRHGLDADSVFGAAVAGLVADGLMTREGSRIRLTRRGVMLANAVCLQFL